MHSCFNHVFYDPVSTETALVLMHESYVKFEKLKDALEALIERLQEVITEMNRYGLYGCANIKES